MSIFSKLKWVASIVLVFLIVLATNLIDQENFKRLSYSVTTIYEDRIVASDLLFEMSMLIQDKELALVKQDSTFFQQKNEAVNTAMAGLIARYKQTKLTEQEQLLFDKLQAELQRLTGQEQSYATAEDNTQLQERIDTITRHLHDLSKIQLEEGRRQVFISNKAMNTIDLFTQGEIIFLIVMAILVQIIILYKPRRA